MNQSALSDKIRAIYSECGRRCGLSFEMFNDMMTEELDTLLDTLPRELQGYGYTFAEKLGWQRAEPGTTPEGYCVHHFDKDTCPMGCGG